jgi:Rrf2 family iron-sulfur cluster assembly transcriptional regulator
MEITKAVKVALSTLVDIANHSSNGQLVPVPEIAKRQQLSTSRIELLLRPLRESGLVIGIRGRAGGYKLSKDPSSISIKDIVLAINRIKKRKVEVSDITKELYQSLETYMTNCFSNVTLASAIKDYIPRFSEVQIAPERMPYFPAESKDKAMQATSSKKESKRVVDAPFKKVEEIPHGPNSIFSFADHLNKNSPVN